MMRQSEEKRARLRLREVFTRYPLAYRRFHQLISRPKQRSLRAHLSGLNRGRPLRVLDLGCGPGQDAALFDDPERFTYLGVDANADYISAARRGYGMDFRVADATTLEVGDSAYDIVLMNSLTHHLDDAQVRAVLATAREALAKDGECLILDMVYPAEKDFSNAVSRALIGLDRGRHCRTERELESHLSAHFRIESKRSFAIKLAGALLWDMRLYVCKRRV